MVVVLEMDNMTWVDMEVAVVNERDDEEEIDAFFFNIIALKYC